jgi:hypothetical protein
MKLAGYPSTSRQAAAGFGTSQLISRNSGAGGGSRTPDLLITNQLLYQLSYAGNGQEC